MIRTQIEKIRKDYLLGLITFEEAKSSIEPLLIEANHIGNEIAKKHNKKFYKLTFSYVMR